MHVDEAVIHDLDRYRTEGYPWDNGTYFGTKLLFIGMNATGSRRFGRLLDTRT